MKDKTLDCVYFNSYPNMLKHILGEMDKSEDYIYAIIVGKYKEIAEILNLIISSYTVEIGDISLCSENCNGYKDEYALMIDNNEDRGVVVYCSPLKTEKGYLGYGADIVYILDNCSSKVQYACEDEAKFVIIGEDECECDCCECCDCDDNNVYGFTVDNETDNGYSKFTYYSSSPVDKTDIRNILREFGL